MRPSPEWSQRLLRKGVFASETYRLFSDWDFDLSPEANLARGLSGREATKGWEREVAATIRRRVRDFRYVEPLICLARRGASFADWRDGLRLWVGATEEPFHSFATGWLFEERQAGRMHVRPEDVRGVVDDAADRRPGDQAPISEYSRVRAARDLLKTAVALGMLTRAGGTVGFSAITLSDDMLVFYAQMIAELEGGTNLVPSSRLWRLAYMTPEDVHLALLNLHLYRRLDYQVAGSLVQLTLPGATAADYVQRMGT